ncbi:MAG: SOS response-associated peptidase [Bacillota bacterium]
MCGRFALVTEKKILDMLFGLELRFDLQPRFNIAPSQEILAVHRSPAENEKEFVHLRWGLVPFWAEDSSIGSQMINARAETAPEKPSFRDAFKKRRLLIPASGFFEWKKEQDGKQPYYVRRDDGEPFAFAGLWERWNKGEKPLETCTILTTEPNSLLVPIHNRMPVIISPKDFEQWLDPQANSAGLQDLLQPYPPGELTAYPVSREVNKPSNDNPDLIKPL